MHMGHLAAAPGLADAPLIRFEKVSYAYPGSDRQVLKDIDLTIDRGEIIGVIGPTGAGKSTFCLALNGIVPQFFSGTFFGTVAVAGLDTIETPTSRLAHLVGMDPMDGFPILENNSRMSGWMSIYVPTVDREDAATDRCSTTTTGLKLRIRSARGRS